MYYHLLFLIILILGTNLNSKGLDDESEEEAHLPKSSGPVIQLKNGYIRGKATKSWSGKTIYSFLGIRYARPPVEKLQFKAPEQWSESWTGVKNMYFDGNKCPQLTFPERKFEGDEDCLFLNVYTSKLMNDEGPDAENLKVFFFLHGGGFTFGSGHSEEYGPQFLLEHDMILVIPNYRLGPYGFLSMGNDDLPGNLGLLDQQLALKWVKDNIAAFGGDPNSITLGGSQAGAISAHIHALTPSSHGLFAKAVALNGNALTSWGVVDPEDAKERALKLGELLECQSNEGKNQNASELTSVELISCISKSEVKNVIWKSQFLMDFNTDFTFPFVPVVSSTDEAIFLKKYPEELIAEGSFTDIPWIVGVTSLPGLTHALQTMVFRKVSNALKENMEINIPVFLDLRSYDEETVIEAGRRIKEFYSLKKNSGSDFLETLGKIFSDVYYFHSLMDTIKVYISKNSSPLYAYHYSYNYRLRRRRGIPQGDDIAMLFPGTHYIFKMKPEAPEIKMMNKMTEFIWSFITTGNPTERSSETVTWNAVKDDNIQFFDIGQEFDSMMNGSDLYNERLLFWDGIYDLLINKYVQLKDEL